MASTALASTRQSATLISPLHILSFIALGALAGLVPQYLNDYWITNLILAATYAIATLGLTVVLGYTGQISLAQGAFYGIGAYTVGVLTTRTTLNFWVALIAAMALTGVLGLLLGLVTLRISGHYLAMVTISFQVIVTLVLTNWSPVTGGSDGVTGIMRPTLGPIDFNPDRTFLYAALIMLFVVGLLLMLLKQSRWGRAMQAIRENSLAAEVVGVPTFRIKVTAFAISALLGGLGGGLYAVGAMYISPDTFDFSQSVTFLTMVLLGGAQWVIGSVFGAIGLTLLPQVLRSIPGSVYLAVYGLVVILVMVFLPDGIWGILTALGRRFGRPAPPRPTTGDLALAPPMHPGGILLRTDALAKRFGGVRAVDGVDLDVRQGEVHALIGPNGSGKSTMLNLLNSMYTPTEGRIFLHDHPIQALASHRIAALGMARTFQNIRLFRNLTVLENVMVGGDTLRYHRRSGVAVRKTPVRQQALAALSFVGMAQRGHELAKNLPYGHQRLVEIARALASEPQVLLLDEPGAGMNPSEKRDLVGLIGRLNAMGMTILLVEHDMGMVTSVSQRITVLNFGKKIASGQPREIMANQDVIDAYLGSDVVEGTIP